MCKFIDDRRQVLLRQSGLGAVDCIYQYLYLRTSASGQVSAKPGRQVQCQVGLTLVECFASGVFAVRKSSEPEVVGTFDLVDERLRRRRAIAVDDQYIDVFDVISGGIGQHEQLENRHGEDEPQHKLVAKDLDKFLLDQKQDAPHSSRILKNLMLSIRNTAVIPPSTRVSPAISLNPTPFSIIPLMMMTNHLAGIIWLTY